MGFLSQLQMALSSTSFSLCGHVSWVCPGLAELASFWVLTPLMVCSGKEATEGPLWLQFHVLQASPLPGSICTHAEAEQTRRRQRQALQEPPRSSESWEDPDPLSLCDASLIPNVLNYKQ